MHEISKAEEVVNKIKKELEYRPDLEKVRIVLGAFTFMEPTRFGYWIQNLMMEREIDEKITVDIVEGKGSARCCHCDAKISSEELEQQIRSTDPHHPVIQCPRCGKFSLDFEEGTEVIVEFLD